MSYTKTMWQDGDIITAEKLNKAENQIETLSNNPDIMLVHMTLSSGISGTVVESIDKTKAEIINAITNDKIVLGIINTTMNGGTKIAMCGIPFNTGASQVVFWWMETSYFGGTLNMSCNIVYSDIETNEWLISYKRLDNL